MVFSLNQILDVSPNLQIAIYLKDYSSLPYFLSTRDPTDPILDTASHRTGREVDGM